MLDFDSVVDNKQFKVTTPDNCEAKIAQHEPIKTDIMPSTSSTEQGHCSFGMVGIGGQFCHYRTYFSLVFAVALISVGSLFLDEGIISSSTTMTVELQSAHEIDDLFFARDSASRVYCNYLDTPSLVSEHASKNSSQLFINCMEALEEAQKEVQQTLCHTPMTIHTFWAKGNLPEVATLSIRSVLHSQPKGCFRYIVWTFDNETQLALAEVINRYNTEKHDVTAQKLNVTDLIHRIKLNFPDIVETVSSAHGLLMSLEGGQDVDPTVLSDAIRFILMGAYGGIYLDLDCLVLRSLQPLMLHDFAYRWSTYGDANTAVLGMRFKSPNTGTLLEFVLKHAYSIDRLNSYLHPICFYRIAVELRRLDIQILPSAYFDPLWVVNDGFSSIESVLSDTSSRYGISNFEGFFETIGNQNYNVSDFFPGVFVFHWHNMWDHLIVPGTMAHMFQQYYDEKELAGSDLS